ncbi:MAG: 3-keto-5-aminohexanoate cleavage protein, partial [Candidatus Latescibacterota bacterium]
MSDKLIISAAVCGSSPTKEQNPKVPYTPEEI